MSSGLFKDDCRPMKIEFHARRSEAQTALVVLSEVGTDMSRWPSEKHFGSWLGLAPNPKKSGGKVHSSATRPGVNRAAQALRLAAKNLQRSHSALGAFFRRIASRRGLAKAITATAYKLARIIYALLKHGTAYVRQGFRASAFENCEGFPLQWSGTMPSKVLCT